MTSVFSVMPDLFVLEAYLREGIRVDTIYLVQCKPNWGPESEIIYVLLKAILLYVLPLVVIFVCYYHVVHVLWSQDIPGYHGTDSGRSFGKFRLPSSCFLVLSQLQPSLLCLTSEGKRIIRFPRRHDFVFLSADVARRQA